MTQARRGLSALALSIAALGLTATTAPAVTWDVEGKEITSTVTATGNLVAGTTLLVLVPAQNIAIHCTGVTVEEGTLLTGNTVHLRLKPTGCTTKVKGVESAGCQPEILPLAAQAKPILHAGRVLLLAQPLTAGSSFTTIHYNEGTCALPPLPTVTGSVAFECYTGALVAADCKTGRVKQLIRSVSGTLESELGDALKYGLNAKTLHIEAEVFLTGISAGKSWNSLI